MKKRSTNAFLLMWDMYGLEAVHSISRYELWEQEQMLDLLRNKEARKNPLNSMLHMWQLRARMNGHRYYEIWAIDCEDTSIDEDFWMKEFEERPQEMVDLIRSKGVCFWNGRSQTRDVRIM